MPSLITLLERLRDQLPALQKWHQYRAEACLVPILQDLRSALDCPDLTDDRLREFEATLRKVLIERFGPEFVPHVPPASGDLRAVDDAGPASASLPVTGRVTNEIQPIVEQLISGLQPPPAPPAPPVPPAPEPS